METINFDKNRPFERSKNAKFSIFKNRWILSYLWGFLLSKKKTNQFS